MRLKELLREFSADNSGATVIEYALIASGISIVIVAAVATIGTEVVNMFSDVNDGF
ncbi:MAG: Flp family type IVb pilin [Rhodobiaceae bacterium]|nr:Flp family type IVb pilin [Rhodobiaceae bacterium]MCC0056917.1 Flp family type IVb pilin [Rhodobiaceae bacterium]